MIRVLFIQGPPGSGKDAVGKILAAANPRVRLVKFAEILKLRTHALFGATDLHGEPLEAAYFDRIKDLPHDYFFGLTPREAYIKVSEEWLKPLAGKQVFGDMLLREMRTYPLADTIFIITDSGFPAEAEPIIEHFGAENCVTLQLERTGHDFSRDSRNYWESAGVKSHRVINDGSLEWLAEKLALLFPDIFPKKDTPHEPSACFAPRPGSDR